MANVFAGFGIGQRSGAPDASPGTSTVPNQGRTRGAWHNPRVLWIWLAAMLVLFIFHIGGASLPGG